MKNVKLIIAVACVALSMAAGSSHAAVDVAVTQYASLNAFGESAWRNIYVRSTYGANSAGPAGRTVWEATASIYDCDDEMNCTGENFVWQRVDPTSLQMDPLGNSVHIVASLTNTQNQVKQFDLTFARPSTLSPTACFPFVVCGNAWLDPDGSAAGAAATSGLSRYGYQVSGTFAGAPFNPDPYWMLDVMAGYSVSASGQLP